VRPEAWRGGVDAFLTKPEQVNDCLHDIAATQVDGKANQALKAALAQVSIVAGPEKHCPLR